jgi:hypothetical protein
MSPMIDEIKVDPNAGHLQERSITIFAYMKSKKLVIFDERIKLVKSKKLVKVFEIFDFFKNLLNFHSFLNL